MVIIVFFHTEIMLKNIVYILWLYYETVGILTFMDWPHSVPKWGISGNNVFVLISIVPQMLLFL